MARPTGSQPLPESGERVMMPPAASTFNKPPKQKPGHDAAVAAATQKRQAWEQSDVGKARMDSGIPKGISAGQFHFINNADIKSDVGPKHYDRQLPGMADPHAAPRPPKYEELSDTNRAHIDHHLALQGTSVEQMTKDFGTQIDQAHVRAHSHGQSEPYASRFYEDGEPRKVVDTSAKKLGIPPQVHSMLNAFTSPNTKFSQDTNVQNPNGTTSRVTRYPNDEAATHAAKWVQQGNKAEDITNLRSDTDPTAEPGKRHQGYVTNIRKAAMAMEQHQAGVNPADWRLGSSGKSPFDTAPKTGPYANSWSDSHPQFTVADVHTGGGGAFPHLSADKPVMYDKSGNPQLAPNGTEKRDKSERERALEKVPFAHSVVDYANRQAMTQRGMGSVRRSQATQWGEEQIQRGEAGLRGAPRASDAYALKEPAAGSAGKKREHHGVQLGLQFG